MATLWNRAGHYIFYLSFLLSFFFFLFFPGLISAVADRMSTILPHMVWPNVGQFAYKTFRLLDTSPTPWTVCPHTLCSKHELSSS